MVVTVPLPTVRPDAFEADILSDGTRDPARLRLRRDGASFGPPLDGSELVASYEIEGGDWLIFLHEGVPFEEAAHIHWLDADGRARGHAHVGVPYATGTLRDFSPARPRGVAFRFFADDRWLAEARPAGGWRGFRGRLTGRPALALAELRE